jgi:hypothetical protein
VFVLCGSSHPLVVALRDAISDPAAAMAAPLQMEALLPLRRSRLTFNIGGTICARVSLAGINEVSAGVEWSCRRMAYHGHNFNNA